MNKRKRILLPEKPKILVDPDVLYLQKTLCAVGWIMALSGSPTPEAVRCLNKSYNLASKSP